MQTRNYKNLSQTARLRDKERKRDIFVVLRHFRSRNILLFTGLEIFLMFLCKLVGNVAIISSTKMIHYEIIYTLSVVTIGLLFMITIFISIIYGYQTIIEPEVDKLYIPRVYIENDCYRIDLKKSIHQGRFKIGKRDYYVDPATGSRFALHRQHSDIDSKRSFDASYPSTSGTRGQVDCIRCGCQPMLVEEEESKSINVV